MNYLELADRVAAIQFHNPDYVLLYRGQPKDYRRKSNTTLKATIFRGTSVGDPQKQNLLKPEVLAKRFEILRQAEDRLIEEYHFTDAKRKLRRRRILRWAILQHYEVCRTPLLDVTHSLRIAASFASTPGGREAYVYILGLPNLAGAVTASAESGVQIVRLASVCPPQARRPHIQEGYLLGEYPDISDIDQLRHFENYEIDFGRRLVAKFRFDPNTFWADGNFPKVEHGALYPNENDPLFAMTQDIKNSLPPAD
ncbi:MAG: FRG domain-containing protein [Rhodobacteraceae bacterium]|nr:FRG domain-containing protein [Paracoccaceae bacterium]